MGELTDLIFTIMGKLGRWLNVRGQRFCFVLEKLKKAIKYLTN